VNRKVCTVNPRSAASDKPGWPLQDIIVLLVVCARSNRPFTPPARLHCPHCFNINARLLGNIPPPPPTPVVYDIHHTILVITISCKGQIPGGAAWEL